MQNITPVAGFIVPEIICPYIHSLYIVRTQVLKYFSWSVYWSFSFINHMKCAMELQIFTLFQPLQSIPL